METGIYADFDFLEERPALIGTLLVENAQSRGVRYAFTFDKAWKEAHGNIVIDPMLRSGSAFYSQKPDFPFLADCMPDRWGRTLILRRAAKRAEEEKKRSRGISDLDFILLADDFTRKGAIRFMGSDGNFLSSAENPIPPLSKLGDYISMISDYEKNGVSSAWLEEFFSSSSSLGGARPKINVSDAKGELWIAKPPSKDDDYDVGAWEQVAHDIAEEAGIRVPEAMLIEHESGHHTYLSRRFDRNKDKRIHMASAECLTGIKDSEARSFLDIAEAISEYSYKPDEDLKELYRRIVLSAMINNTDNHMRNHSFLLSEEGWALSPAYDMNPSIRARASSLAIDESSHSFSLSLIRETAAYYNISEEEADEIIGKTEEAVSTWEKKARCYGLAKEITLLRSAFEYY